MWLEFYSLGEDKGVTFECAGVDICGWVYRVKFKQGEDYWWFNRDEDGMFWMCNRWWTDLGVTDKHWKHFKRITQKEAKKWMLEQ